MLISYDIIGSIGGSKVMINKEFKLMSKKQWRGLANSCLDFIVDSIGIDNTLIMLFKNGVSKENLIELHFSLYDIEKAYNFYKLGGSRIMSYKFILDSNKDLFIERLSSLVIDYKVLESKDNLNTSDRLKLDQLHIEIMTMLKETF